MTLPLGLNIFSWNDGARAVCDRLQPAALLFLSNDGGATEAAMRYPACKVITRIVNDHEEKHLHETPGATRRYLQSRHAQVDGRCYINLGCEAPTDRLHDLISETVDGLTWCVENRVKVAAPHGAFYAINPPDFPTLDPLADLICAHPDLFLFTVDEYSGGHAFSGVVDVGVPGGNEIGHIAPEHWRAGPVPAKWQDTQYWHAGRITNYFRYRKALGKPLPLTVITENGMDALGDIATWLKSLHNTGSADGTRGWQTLAPQWRDWYSAWSGDVAYAQMMAAQWREIYALWPNILGGCLYAYGTNGDPEWNSYRVDGHQEFFDTLLKMNWKGSPVSPLPIVHVPVPVSPAVTRVVAPNSHKFTSANVRAEPTTAATIVGAVKVGDTVSLRIPAKAVSADGYTWVYCETQHGWVADVVDFVALSATFGPAQVDLALSFVTQNAPTPPEYNLCGPASEAMLVRWVAVQEGNILWQQVTREAVAKSMPTRPPGANTSFNQIETSTKLTYGFTLLERQPDANAMKAELDAGRPFIAVLVRDNKYVPETSTIYSKDIGGTHILVVGGYGYLSDGGVYFIVYDPLGFDGQLGDGLKVKAAGLLAGMNATSFTATALFIDPASLSPLPPPPVDPEPLAPFTDAQIAWLDARYLPVHVIDLL